jgi:hypothetical protein
VEVCLVGVIDRLLALTGKCCDNQSNQFFGIRGVKTKLDGLGAKALHHMLLEICGGIAIL